MTRLYQGFVMAAIILSAGIIGHFEEESARHENNAEAIRHVDRTDVQIPPQRTTVARLD